ncbi:hypothetical protein KDD17_17335 [Sulfitobacter albidus]|uniref:LysM domain-containing protein n=1 Tax=Sulfitobacter albidus TaxID=2829501 RepID=A0A975JGI8_9RHOB|nr:hypothetical protein [Sulfitobacter albidus]QUJ78104.1 hypothetical protein KDD17_17335 [Sulfitobacter albidus]
MSATFYTVEPGDQLYRILRSHYGDGTFFERGEDIIDLVRKSNPQITDIDRIFPGQSIALPGAPGLREVARPLDPHLQAEIPLICNELAGASPAARGWMADVTADMVGGKLANAVGSSYVQYVKSQSQKALESFTPVIRNQSQRASREITRGAYDGRRIKYLGAYDKSLGGLKPLHRPFKQSRAVLHVKPHADVPAGALLSEVKTLNRYLRLASKGVTVIRVISFAEVATDVGMADTGSAQAQLMAKSGGGLIGGVFGTVAAGAVFAAAVATPVGWVAVAGILLAGAGGAAGSILGEELADRASRGMLYDANGRAIYTEKLLNPASISLP